MDFNLFIIVFIITAIICGGGAVIYKAYTSNRLVSYVTTNDQEKFFKTVDKFLVKFMLEPYKREYMRLCMLMQKGNYDEIDEQLQMMLNMRIKANDRLDTAIKAFYFYVDARNKTKANEALRQIRKYADENVARQAQIIYDIELDNSVKYIKDCEVLAKKTSGYDGAIYDYYLGIQYDRIGNKKDAKTHFERALKEMKNTPYEIKINKYLNK